MSRRSGRKRGKGSRRDCVCFVNEDIKLQDFADNPSTRLPSRPSKKTFANKIKYEEIKMSSAKQESEPQLMQSKLVTMTTEEAGPERQEEDADLAWDERDWDGDDVGYSHGNAFEEEEEDEEEDNDGQTRRRKKNSNKKSKKLADAQAPQGLVYPPDLWFILADYIRPEDVATFACLCPDAYNVTRTATFWRSLYHRHYNPSTELPISLKPSKIKRNFGLRASVIRALYLMYEPFRLAVTTPSPVGEGKSSPDTVTDYLCLYTWARGKLGGHFTHFLKMRRNATAPETKTAHGDPGVRANASEGECILKVHCEHFQDVPSAHIMGLRVIRASVSVSANMRQHRMKLVFGRMDRRGYPVKSSLVAVSLDPVMKVEVLHWWHPQFNECSRRSIDRAVADNVANARERNLWDGL